MQVDYFWKVTFKRDNEIKSCLVCSQNKFGFSNSLKKAITNLPFKKIGDLEKLKSSDLHIFIHDLYSNEVSIIIDENGKVAKIKNDPSLDFLNDRKNNIFDVWKSEFLSCLNKRNKNFKGPKKGLNKILTSKFHKSLKYIAAWDMYEQWILEEARFYSLIILLDTTKELEASCLLSANFYYKQAVQMLRNFLELIVAQFYFSSNNQIYKNWKSNPNIKMPKFGGKYGMVQELLASSKINSAEAKALEEIFQKLSAYTHSKYQKLIHFSPKSQIRHFDFDEIYFEEWNDLLAETVEICLKVVYKHTKHWEMELIKDTKLRCFDCHEDNFDITTESYGKIKIYLYTCRKCRNQIRTNKLVKS